MNFSQRFLLCCTTAVVAAGCVTHNERLGISRPPERLRPVALGPVTGSFVEATGFGVDASAWGQTPDTREVGVVENQPITMLFAVRNLENKPLTDVPWQILEGGKEVAAGTIKKIGAGSETIVRARYQVAGATKRNLRFAGVVNPKNAMKESAGALGDNRVTARLTVVPQ